MATPGRTSPKKFQPKPGNIITADAPSTRGRAVDRETVKSETQNFKQQFHLDNPSKIKPILKTLIVWHEAIVRWKKAFVGLPKGAQIVFRNVNDERTNRSYDLKFTSEHVKAADELFKKGIKNIEFYLRAKGTKRVLPGQVVERKNAFNVITYVPEGSPLLGWMKAEEFGTADGLPLRRFVSARLVLEAATRRQQNPADTFYAFVSRIPGFNDNPQLSASAPLFESGVAYLQTIDNLFNLAVGVGGSNGGAGLIPPNQVVNGKVKKMGSFFDANKSEPLKNMLRGRAQFMAEYDVAKKKWYSVPIPEGTNLSVAAVVGAKIAGKRKLDVDAAARLGRAAPVKHYPWDPEHSTIFYRSHLKALIGLSVAPAMVPNPANPAGPPIDLPAWNTVRSWPLIQANLMETPRQLVSEPNIQVALAVELDAVSKVLASRSAAKKASAKASSRAGKIPKPTGL